MSGKILDYTERIAAKAHSSNMASEVTSVFTKHLSDEEMGAVRIKQQKRVAKIKRRLTKKQTPPKPTSKKKRSRKPKPPESTYKAEYRKYLKGEVWLATRKGFIVQHKTKVCELCGSGEKLRVHHHTYKRVGSEKISDLALVCNSCHARIHFKNGKKINLSFLRGRFDELTK